MPHLPYSSALIDAERIVKLTQYLYDGLLTQQELLWLSLDFPEEERQRGMLDELQMRAEARKAARWCQENT